MRKQLSLLLMLLLPIVAVAQSALQAPKNVYFADIHIKLSDGAQQEVQKRIDYLHKNPKFLMMRVDLADSYFPVIERTFKEEGVPDDFKYLALMESDLIGDAISTSNAVGYWQFKREAAADFNLVMNNNVDERRHIIEASRGAARYFKRSNNFYDNWLNTLLSYYEGYTGAKAYTKPSDKGARKMELTERSHPYLLKFTAYKVAYESYVGKNTVPPVSLRELRATPGQSLADIALATQTDYSELERYNKWLLGSSVPADKDYLVMIPIRNNNGDGGLLASNVPSAAAKPTATPMAGAAGRVKLNNLNAIVARKGDTKDKLALQAGLSTRKFLKYNDLRSFDKIEEGQVYYLEPKRNKSTETDFHVVKAGETMQSISQQHGVKLSHLVFNNRMSRAEAPVPGRVLWLHKRRPNSTPVEVRDTKQSQSAAAVIAKATIATPAKVAAAPAAKPQAAQPEEKKENIFTRFINSLKRKKPEPAETETQVAAAQTRTTPAAEPAKPVEDDEDIFVTVEEAAPVQQRAVEQNTGIAQKATEENKTAEAPKAKTGTLYPGDRSVPPVPATAEKEEKAKTPPAVTPVAAEAAAEAQEEETTFIPEEEETTFGDTTKAYVTIIEDKPAPAPAKATPAAAQPEAAPEEAPAKTDTYRAFEAEADEAPAATAKPAPQQPATKHVVKEGETLYSISRIYAVSINDINNWNNLGEEAIKIGQELLIAEPLTMPDNSNSESATEAAPALHTVAAGESLYKISKRYNISVDNLRQWNSLSTSNLSIGQELRLTAPAAAESTSPAEPAEQETTSFSGNSTHHTVKSGESMYQISRKYGVTIKDIMEWNNKTNFDVSLGEKLLIKKK